MFGMPATTAYDLRFRMLGIPVRVHPFFWLVMALIGGVGRSSPQAVLIFMVCGFASILVHELGHGLTARLFGYDPAIVLYGLGGLCYSEGERQTPRERLAVISGGPGAGLLLCALTLLVGMAAYRLTPVDLLNILGNPVGLTFGRSSPALLNVAVGLAQDDPRALVFWVLVYINFWWSLLNLLPIWPLDGGQLSGVVLSMVNRANGRRWAHVISLLTAGVLAILMFRLTRDLFLTLFFAFFALMNFQILQAMHAQNRYGFGGMEDESDWWRR